MRYVLVLFLVGYLDKGYSANEKHQKIEAKIPNAMHGSIFISKSDVENPEENWPFTKDKMKLGCTERQGRPLVWVEFNPWDNRTYGLNGAARGLGKKMLGYSDSTRWQRKIVKNYGGTKVEIPVSPSYFIDVGKRLCAKK